MTAFRSRSRCSVTPYVLAVLVSSFLVCGCSSYPREWKQTAAGTPRAGVEGAWEGSWVSEKNGHHGELRCLMYKFDDRTYEARFKATYWKVLRIGYDVAMMVEKQPDGSFKLEGENDLGWWGGGVYHYQGHVSPTNFHATYRSQYDHGSFQMQRPEGR